MVVESLVVECGNKTGVGKRSKALIDHTFDFRAAALVTVGTDLEKVCLGILEKNYSAFCILYSAFSLTIGFLSLTEQYLNPPLLIKSYFALFYFISF